MSRLASIKTKLTTPLLAETRDWYRDLLGLAVFEEWDLPDDKGCILGIPDAAGEALLEIYEGPKAPDCSGLSLQFRVDDVRTFPIPVEPRFACRGPEARPWGSTYLFLTDPNGVSVVVFSGTSL